MWFAWFGVGLAAEVPAARTSEDALPTVVELQALAQEARRKCSPAFSALWPGVSRFCVGRPVEGALLGGLAAGHLSAAIALNRNRPEDGTLFEDGGVTVPISGFQQVYLTSLGLELLDLQRARLRPYTPQEQLGDLVSAPFRPSVLRRPSVWLGGLALTGGAAALTLALNDPDPTNPSPNLFGREFRPAVGYPLFTATNLTHFLHVAVGEEVVFRGLLQSALTRAMGPTPGWLLGTALFGAFHVPNAFGLPQGQRLPYLLLSLPYITLAGAWFGLVYRWSDYRLGPPIAVHFWYNFTLGALAFALDPDDHPFSASITVRF